jgi:MFS family permease
VAIARDRGGSLDQLSIVYALGLAWAVKFLWAPLVDRFGSRRFGHYRSWLLVTQPATALVILAIAPFDVVANLGFIVLALAVVALLSATQDIATDALAVRTFRGRARGGVNGMQVGANFVGDIIGGGLILVVYDIAGWVPAIVTLAVVTAVPIGFIARIREPALGDDNGPDQREAGNRVRLAAVLGLFRQRGATRWALLLSPLLTIAMGGSYGMLVPILVDSGMSIGMVGVLTNVVAGVIGVAAAVVAGLLVPTLGRRRSLIVYGLGQAVAIASVVPVALGMGGTAWMIVAIVLVAVFNSAGYAAMYTINMDFSRHDTAGSDFTVQVSVAYFVRFAAAGVFIGVAAAHGYVITLLVCVGIALLAVVAVAALFVPPGADERAHEAAEPALPRP